MNSAPPLRSKVSGALAAFLCAACCALPLLIAAGVLTSAGAAVLERTLIAVSAGLAVAALGMWWLHRRRGARRAAMAVTSTSAVGAGGAGGPACGCGGGCGC